MMKAVKPGRLYLAFTLHDAGVSDKELITRISSEMDPSNVLALSYVVGYYLEKGYLRSDALQALLEAKPRILSSSKWFKDEVASKLGAQSK